MTSYKANTKSELYYVLLCAAVLIGSFALSKKPITALYAGGVFIPLFIIYNLFSSRLSEILVDKKKGKLTFIYRNYFRKKKEQVYDLSKIEFTYKRGDTFKHNEKKNICTLYNGDAEIAKFKRDIDGWTSDIVFDLVFELKELGIKRKFTGYMMKDAEV
jgi:hypothetical protein